MMWILYLFSLYLSKSINDWMARYGLSPGRLAQSSPRDSTAGWASATDRHRFWQY